MDAVRILSVAKGEGCRIQNEPLIPKFTRKDLPSDHGKPFGVSFRSSKAFIIFVVCVAVFTDTFLYSLIIPILPDTLTQRAGVQHKDVQRWISVLLGVYGAANLVVSLIAGHLIDRMDTRRASLLFGLCALIGSTAMFCFATTPTVLVVARALQGASSTVLEIASLALLSDTMGASTTGTAMGWQSVGRFFGVILGPSLSGVVFDLYGHFAVFGMAFLVLIFDLVLRFMMIERKVADKWILDADKNYSTIGPSQPTTNQVRHQNAAEERTGEGCDGSTATDQSKKNLACSSIPGTLDLLANPRLLMAYWATFTCSITITSLESVLPLYTMELFNWTPSESGMLFILLAFSIILDPYIGHSTDTQGPRVMAVLGFLLSSILWVAFCAVTANTARDKVLVGVLLCTIGFSIALIAIPNTVDVSLAVHDMNQKTLDGFDTGKVMGLAYSFMNMSYGIGSIMGPFWGGVLIQTSGWRVLCISFGVLNILTASFAWFFSGRKKKKEAIDTDDLIT